MDVSGAIAEQAEQSASQSPLAINVIGALRISFANREIRIRSRKAGAVLAYLILEESGTATRERLVGLLWSESEEERARASLRQVVHEMREALRASGCFALQSDRMVLALDPQSVQLDLREVLSQAEAGSVHPLLLNTPRLTEALLADLDDLDPAFRVWLMARRQTLYDRFLRALEPLLKQQRPPNDPVRRQAAQAILQLDPTHEEACRTLMWNYAAAGDPISALRAYEALWRVLADDYDTEPTAATQQLVAEIKLGRVEPLSPPPTSAGPSLPEFTAAATPPRIALLVEPIAIHGVGQDRTHLVQGFRHDLIARLVRFREWFVVDGAALPPPDQTRTRVSGRYRVSGSAYGSGEQVSVGTDPC